MFFARKAAVVFTCEPNPWNYARSAEEVKLNQLANVRVFNPGLSSKPSELEMGGRSADAGFRPMRNSRGRFENAGSNADHNDSVGYARFGYGAACLISSRSILKAGAGGTPRDEAHAATART